MLDDEQGNKKQSTRCNAVCINHESAKQADAARCGEICLLHTSFEAAAGLNPAQFLYIEVYFYI